MMATSSELTIGVLLFGETQLLDISNVDLFAMCSKSYLTACELPAPLIARGFDTVTIHYIAEGVTTNPHTPVPHSKFTAAEKTSLMPTTASLSLHLTADITDPCVAPGRLDILLIPGPDP